jgi:hypothetical protein
MLSTDGYPGLTWMILPNYLSAFRAAAVLSAGCRSQELNIEKIEGIWNRFAISVQPDDIAILKSLVINCLYFKQFQGPYLSSSASLFRPCPSLASSALIAFTSALAPFMELECTRSKMALINFCLIKAH